MPINEISRRLNNLTRTPYKTALFLNEGHLYKTIHYAINERIENSWGIFKDSKPIYIKNHISVFAFDITNALSKKLDLEEKAEDDARKKLAENPSLMNKAKEKFANFADIFKDSSIDMRMEGENIESLKFFINKISPEELTTIYNLNSFKKATKTPENKNKMDMKTLLFIFIVCIAVIGGYLKITGRI